MPIGNATIKNVAGNRVSITCVRIGSAGGSNVPITFLAKGNKGNESVNKIYRHNRLNTVYNLPEGSSVICNDTAYMDDETWLKVAKTVAPGIPKMPFIRDHPD